ncbi:uncharacterized protein F4817DRAFT_339929 [Daldinia loculata]|uniref:uncharacterized protein n=1 Tax=Daldinia loculata TaxID=103429 RepID=UPI0020C30813|nr:uncharacterized protein F4817DRAFT_339929 [Daldinia loculata]KAI1646671.1 hypothetical protein F4817DRAFT_339929 [Daldinia loculata]
MDIFQTTVTASTLLIQFLGACSEFSSEAESLKTQLEWDLRALRVAQDVLMKIKDGGQQLSADDADLVKRTSEYLHNLTNKVNRSLKRTGRRGWLYSTINKGTWIARRPQLQDMQKEIHEWTVRLDVRLLALIGEFGISIPTIYDKTNSQSSAVFGSNNKLQEFLTLSSIAKSSRTNATLLDDPDGLISRIESTRDISSLPFHDGTQQMLFSCRGVSASISQGTSAFEKLVSEMGELAAALHCLDPSTDVRLLKVKYYFYHPDMRQFLFAQIPPYSFHCMMTLEELIMYNAFPRTETTLDECFKIAYKLAEAVFFLHTAGFCHKNITSRSIVILRRFDMKHGETTIPITDEAYLMGLDLIRGTDALTYGEGVVGERDSDPSRSIWDFDIFQHPDRLKGSNSARYNKTYDIYSLGVVLLAIGFWEPLSKILEPHAIDKSNPASWAQQLSQVAPNLRFRVGQKYRRVVQWCIELSGERIIKNAEFIQEVLDPLEEMMNALG